MWVSRLVLLVMLVNVAFILVNDVLLESLLVFDECIVMFMLLLRWWYAAWMVLAMLGGIGVVLIRVWVNSQVAVSEVLLLGLSLVIIICSLLWVFEVLMVVR